MAQKNVKFVGKTSILPISTMLYMTEEDLQERLALLTGSVKLDYAYICHKGEGGKKDHIHILLRSQTERFKNIDRIRDCLYEICDCDTDTYKKGQSKPCKPFVETKSLRDWYLYSMHNSEYLASKGETREFEYSPSDVKGSSNLLDDLKCHTDNFTEKETDLQIITTGILNGETDMEIIVKLQDVTSSNLFSVLKGIAEMRKVLTITDEKAHDLFIEALYKELLKHEKSRNWIISAKLGLYVTDGSDVLKRTLEKLTNDFIDHICNYDMLYHYLND